MSSVTFTDVCVCSFATLPSLLAVSSHCCRQGATAVHNRALAGGTLAETENRVDISVSPFLQGWGVWMVTVVAAI